MQSIGLQYNNPEGLKPLMKWAADEIPNNLLTKLLGLLISILLILNF
jgi:hypothetical protein